MKASRLDMPPHLVVMAAGTGGHIVPGLAVAREMLRRGWRVSWLGTRQGMENRLVPAAQIELDTIAFAGLRGKGLMQTLLGVFRLLRSLFECARILRRRDAKVVIGMGGYVCLPGGVMAWLTRRPLVLVNADAGLLLSNRLLAPMADRIAFGFAGAAAQSTPRGVVTGNPVRSEIEALPEPSARYAQRSGPLRMLVVGGSLGARVLNETVPAAIALMPAHLRPKVIHQTGAEAMERVRDAYANAGIAADVRAFVDDMANCLAESDVVVCRAGAITVSELCAAGVASVLVPLVIRTTTHQWDNAQWMAGEGAAILLPQPDLDAAHLARLLASFDRADLLKRAVRARALARIHAASRVADEIERLVRV